MFVRVVLWDDTSLRAVLAAQPLLNVFLTYFAQFSCLHWTIYDPQSIWACLKVPEEYLSTSFLHFPTRCAHYFVLPTFLLRNPNDELLSCGCLQTHTIWARSLVSVNNVGINFVPTTVCWILSCFQQFNWI